MSKLPPNLLQGRIALVTGANRGLGLEIARAYLRAGARIAICARSSSMLDSAREQLLAEGFIPDAILASTADVACAEDGDRLVRETIARYGKIDVLVNNAGVYGPKGPIEANDWSEWVEAIGVNLLGSVLMARAVLPHFKGRHSGKIVQISGGGATNPLPNLSAYAVSKAGIVRFVETVAHETREFGIDVNAIAPGALNTGMLEEILAAGPERVGQAFFERSLQQKASGGTPLGDGAALAVYLGSALSDGISGRLISAVWDPWSTLQTRRDALRGSDIYTLRRIVPADRGEDFGNGG
jgi:NAD(P)-dependent dehydrogenase (short-subunit alcohol dehydrogenase family)